MWELDYKESWALKNWCFWTVVLEKTLESPLDCKEIQPVHLKRNQSWILAGLMLKLKLQYFVHLMWRTDPFEKTLMLGKIEGGKRRGDREWDGWMASSAQWTWVWVNSRSWWWTGKPGMLQSMGSQRARLDWVTELNWTKMFILPLELGFSFIFTFFFSLRSICHFLNSTLNKYQSFTILDGQSIWATFHTRV